MYFRRMNSKTYEFHLNFRRVQQIKNRITALNPSTKFPQSGTAHKSVDFGKIWSIFKLYPSNYDLQNMGILFNFSKHRFPHL